MGALQIDTALRSTARGLMVELSRDWRASWGPNGGYLAALALRAAGMAAPVGHRPATISCQFLGRADFAVVSIDVQTVKAGVAAALMNVTLLCDGRPFVQAQIWSVPPRSTPLERRRRMPRVGPPRAESPIAPPVNTHPLTGEPLGGFWDNFERRPARYESGEGQVPGALREWFRFEGYCNGRDEFLDAGRAAILLDTLNWVAFKSGLSCEPCYFAPTIDLTVNFHEPSIDADWLLADVRAEAHGRGLVHGAGEIWSQDGSLLASATSNLLIVDLPTRVPMPVQKPV